MIAPGQQRLTPSLVARMARAGGLISCPLFLLFLCLPVQAHQQAQAIEHWINKYTSPITGENCCGEDDCNPLADYDVTWSSSGWKILSRNETVPDAEALLSKDGRFWYCERGDGSRRCFLKPQIGY